MVLDAAHSVRPLAPEITLVAGAFLVLAWDLVAASLSPRARLGGIFAIALVALFVAAALPARALAVDAPEALLFGGDLADDRFARFFRTVLSGITALIVVAAVPTREAQRDPSRGGAGGELVALLLVAALGMNLMAMGRTLLLVYIAIETVSVLSFVLAGFKDEARTSGEAALKYAVFGGVASGVMLYGMSWIFGLSRSLAFPDIAARTLALTRDAGHVPAALAVGAACVLAGFAYKISAVPFHMWAPDVYEGSPTLVAAFLSVGPKAAGFAILVRFFHDALGVPAVLAAVPSAPWPVLAGLLAVATMTLGNLSALGQTNLKRMLAYSSIAQAGYMLLAFAVFTPEGIAAIAFYVVAYCAMNVGAFLVVLAVADANGGDESIDAFRALGVRAPAMAIGMAVFLFSLVGLPPFSGFVGKVYIFAALLRAAQEGVPTYRGWYVFLAVVGVVNTVVSLFYYARVLRAMYLVPAEIAPNAASAPAMVNGPLRVNRLHGALTAALVVPTVALGLYWGPLYDFILRSLTIVP